MPLQLLFVLVSILLALAGTTFSQATERIVQVSTHDLEQSQKLSPQVLFKPAGSGQPPTTRGAGSRNDRTCAQDTITQPLALTALVPSQQFGLTWAERPTLWVYLPKTSARQLVLSIREAGNLPHSQSFLPITGEAGVMGIQVAATAPALEVGKSYQWAVVLVCGDRPSPNDPVVTAWMRRVLPSPSIEPPEAPLDRAALYGEQGIWYDALTTLAEAYRAQPHDSTLTQIWAEFLAQSEVGLGEIATMPLH
ncbi:DUF928 domain-containing protein [Pantanalinema rosaneae CENA516]|uniref:DUF928 domain-containing protein n=1 Tax=Pantanalinema rosaneae TaxID=1620701 RepID=UPI003D6F10C9